MAEYNYKYSNGKGLWFTSDLHFEHANIIKYCNRPFKDVDEMRKKIIENWNSVVGKDDTVFILGDIGFGPLGQIIENVKQLNGKKILIPGNHDRGYIGKPEFDELFEEITPQVYMKVEKKRIYLNHLPFLAFDGAYLGKDATWQLFGHCHSFPGSLGLDVQRLVHLFPTQYDVGMDNNHYTPVSFEQVKQIINNQQESLNLIRQC